MLAAWIAACRGPRAEQDACSVAVDLHDTDAGGVCLTLFEITGNAGIGARAARELSHDPARFAYVSSLAYEIGDREGGADAWEAVGGVHLERGEYTDAIIAFKRALAHRATTDAVGRRRDAQGLYRSYFHSEQYGQAMRYAALAYQLADVRDDPETRATVLAGVATLLFDIGDLPACEKLMSAADAAVDAASSPRAWVQLVQLHGLVDLAHRRYALARTHLTKAADEARRAGLLPQAREALQNLVAVELQANNPAAAADALRMAPPPSEKDPDDPIVEAYVEASIALARGEASNSLAIITRAMVGRSKEELYSLEELRGRALRLLGRREEAEDSLLNAIRANEQHAADLDLDSFKGWMIDQARGPFEDLFGLYVEEGRYLDALAIAQRATARAFIDGLASRPARSNGTLSTAIEQDGLRVDAMRTLVHELRASPTTEAIDGPALLRRLGSRVVFTYFRARDDLWLVVAGHGQVRVREIGTVDELERLTHSWMEAPARADIGDALGARLFPEDLLPPPGQIIFVVVDDPLRDLSFAAIRVDGDYLVRRNPVSYVPSAAVLVALDAQPPRIGSPVVLGDPTGDLHEALVEANAVATIVGTNALTGPRATRAVVQSAGGASLLHVAGHASETALGPALELADGTIGASDVLEGGLSPDVVVLTSCASADPGSRDQLAPLASAFLAAGSRAVVASRWVVADDIAARFARAFYAEGGAKDPVVATAHAQLRLADEGVDVAAWATFVVSGGAKSPNP